jgi:CheY-like chemotaxis protein
MREARRQRRGESIVKVLIVHRRDEVGSFWARSLERSGAQVSVVSRPDDAVKALRFDAIDVVVLDLGLPDRGAFSVSDHLTLHRPDLAVIAIASTPGHSAVPYFDLMPNVRHIMGASAQLADLAAIVEHYGPKPVLTLRRRA